MMNNEGIIFANELDKFRCERLKYNVEKQGATIIHTINEDGTNIKKISSAILKNCFSKDDKNNTKMNNQEDCNKTNYNNTQKDDISKTNLQFDKILVDVPCSGEGKFLISDRKTYEHWSLSMQKNLIETQKGLLETAIKLCKPNGTIVYSTCALSRAENEKIIDWAIKNFDIEVEKIELSLENTNKKVDSDDYQKENNIKYSKNEDKILKENKELNLKSQESFIIKGNSKGIDESINNTIKILPSKIFEGFYVARLRKSKLINY